MTAILMLLWTLLFTQALLLQEKTVWLLSLSLITSQRPKRSSFLSPKISIKLLVMIRFQLVSYRMEPQFWLVLLRD